MKIAKEIPNSYSGTNIGWKALSIIVTLPKVQKQKEIPNVDTCHHLGKKDLYLIATLSDERTDERRVRR